MYPRSTGIAAMPGLVRNRRLGRSAQRRRGDESRPQRVPGDPIRVHPRGQGGALHDPGNRPSVIAAALSQARIARTRQVAASMLDGTAFSNPAACWSTLERRTVITSPADPRRGPRGRGGRFSVAANSRPRVYGPAGRNDARIVDSDPNGSPAYSIQAARAAPSPLTVCWSESTMASARPGGIAGGNSHSAPGR